MSDAENKANSGREIVEIGWVVAGRMDNTDLQAAHRTRKQLLDYLRGVFPEFDWRLPTATRKEFVPDLQGRTIGLLDMVGTDRDVRHWDFAVPRKADTKSQTHKVL